jgi:hypothetical protein
LMIAPRFLAPKMSGDSVVASEQRASVVEDGRE